MNKYFSGAKQFFEFELNNSVMSNDMQIKLSE